MIFKGFKFGLLLQVAVGPICIYIFNVASNHGFLQAELAVSAVTLADSMFILLALLGLTSFVEKPKIKKFFGIFGALVVIIFGVNILMGALGYSILPDIHFLKTENQSNTFLYAFLLTCANPLTILFWAGVFASRLQGESNKKGDLYLFGLGAACSTGIVLTIVSIIGSITSNYLPDALIRILNAVVGLVLILFAVKMLLKNKVSLPR